MALTRARVGALVLVPVLAAGTVLLGVPSGPSVAAGLTKATVKKIAKKTVDKELTKKASTLTVARAGTADALGGTPAAAYAKTGVTQLSLSGALWHEVNGPVAGVTVYRSGLDTIVNSSGVHNQNFAFPVNVPTSANGVRLSLDSVRFCYNLMTGSKISNENLSIHTWANGVSSQPVASYLPGATNITTDRCQLVPVGRTLGPDEAVLLFVAVSMSDGNQISLGGVQAQLSPTSTPAGPLS